MNFAHSEMPDAPVSHEVKGRLEGILANRTAAIQLVVEDVYQPHNGASVIRSCDGFGVQHLHAISNRNPFQIDESLTRGCHQFLSIHHYSGELATAECLSGLRARGFRIAATTLRPGAIPLGELDMAQKIAVVFGAEERGLSEEAHSHADLFLRIPMFGLTQSLNISVSVALCLHHLRSRLPDSPLDWHLDQTEAADLRAAWLKIEPSQALAPGQ